MNSRLVITLCVVGACTAFVRSPLAHVPSSGNHSDSVVASSRHRANEPEVRIDTKLGVRVNPSDIQFAFDVANTGSHNVELSFPSGQSYDIAVLDSVGREVWRWGKDRMFTSALQTRMIGSGDTLRVAERLDAHIAPGRYVAVATLRSSNFPAIERVPFIVQ